MVDHLQPALKVTLRYPCAHHWRIEKPAGATSKGICKYCGASRDFRNYSYLLAGQTPYRARRSPTNQ